MLWTIVLAISLVALAWMLGRRNAHPLDKLPSPPRIPILGHVWMFINVQPRELYQLTRSLIKEYGDRFVIKILGRRILHLSAPNDVELVLSHSKNITKSLPYKFLEPWLGTGLLLSTGQKWQRRRKILTPTFHFNILKDFVPILEEKSLNMVEMLRRTQGREQELFPLISDVTLYAICETAMGTQLDQDKSTSAVEYKKAILQIGRLLLSRLTKFWLHSDFIFDHLPIGWNFQKVLHKVHSFADDVILERKRHKSEEGVNSETDDFGGKRRVAMLDLLLEAESKGEIDLGGIREEVNTFMFEGHDTTATALTFGIMLLADHEDVQKRIYEEIQAVLGDRTPSMTDLAELKYLEAVIKEILRLYPSVPFIARTIAEDFYLSGEVLVPKGAEVAVHILDLHRRADLYPEPEAFKPERFLDGSTRHPYGYVPFSAGPRNCIGQRFAMLEMKSILCAMCRNFSLVSRSRGWMPKLSTDLVLRSTEPIYVKFVERTSVSTN